MKIVPARICHVNQMLAKGLRAADVREVWAANGISPKIALTHSFCASPDMRYAAIEDDGQAFCMFGVAPYLNRPRVGSPWLLATDGITRHRRDLLRYTREIVPKMLKPYDLLVNHVDARHEESIRWLRWAGFLFVDLLPAYGHERVPFLKFIMESPRV